jgi:hypothetical protein
MGKVILYIFMLCGLYSCGTPHLKYDPGSLLMMDIGMSIEDVREEIRHYQKKEKPKTMVDDYVRSLGIKYHYLRLDIMVELPDADHRYSGSMYYPARFAPFYLVFKNDKLFWLGYPYEARRSYKTEISALGDALAALDTRWEVGDD